VLPATVLGGRGRCHLSGSRPTRDSWNSGVTVLGGRCWCWEVLGEPLISGLPFSWYHYQDSFIPIDLPPEDGVQCSRYLPPYHLGWSTCIPATTGTLPAWEGCLHHRWGYRSLTTYLCWRSYTWVFYHSGCTVDGYHFAVRGWVGMGAFWGTGPATCHTTTPGCFCLTCMPPHLLPRVPAATSVPTPAIFCHGCCHTGACKTKPPRRVPPARCTTFLGPATVGWVSPLCVKEHRGTPEHLTKPVDGFYLQTTLLHQCNGLGGAMPFLPHHLRRLTAAPPAPFHHCLVPLCVRLRAFCCHLGLPGRILPTTTRFCVTLPPHSTGLHWVLGYHWR